ncbi:hypothetical protein BOTBODRAFT_175646 [Botryobasidium botryosum FD-172 SS1]|uniref:MalT-like TPR region domain-containing protein n=1 Tax=Botryobasidium botryosum (strain FD-172 SS1) TaxID=930990 RepID=A0A067MC86_BOTB1|nr:hypothetical protein BOTBODRAFT_175646 [Botryobasidium botryosum FD-172 SS1]
MAPKINSSHFSCFCIGTAGKAVVCPTNWRTFHGADGLWAWSYVLRYEFYTSMTVWPKELRPDLRAAVKAKHQNDLDLSEKYFRTAWGKAAALSDPEAVLGSNHLLKTSGIAVALGDVLEQNNKLADAYNVYCAAYEALHRSKLSEEKLEPSEMKRSIGIALKLGEIAGRLRRDDDEEAWLVCSFEETLKAIRGDAALAGVSTISSRTGDIRDDGQIALDDLDLPEWLNKAELGAVTERLGEFYARKGNAEYAVPLYLQAISLLIPPTAKEDGTSVTPENRCRGAMLMNNLASLLVSSNASVPQARAWAAKAFEVTLKARKDVPGEERLLECEHVLVAALFNLGMLDEMEGKLDEAKDRYSSALGHSRGIGMKEGVKEAQLALRRIGGSTTSKKS